MHMHLPTALLTAPLCALQSISASHLLLHFEVGIHGTLRQLAGRPQLCLCRRARQRLLQRLQPTQPLLPLPAGQLKANSIQALLQRWI